MLFSPQHQFSFSEPEKFHTFQWKLIRWKMRKNSIDDKNYNPKPKININTQTNNNKKYMYKWKGWWFLVQWRSREKVSRLKVAKCQSVFGLAPFSKNLQKHCPPTFQTNVKSGWQFISFIFSKKHGTKLKISFEI